MIFFFNDTATTEIYTLSLHDALPISCGVYMTKTKTQMRPSDDPEYLGSPDTTFAGSRNGFSAMILWDYLDRKSTRLNSSHANISYAVFCLKKKNSRSMFAFFARSVTP